MKNLFKVFGVIALVAVIGFTFIACDNSGGGGGPQTATYTGKSGDTTYTLKITENTARYTAQNGDAYELTGGSKKSLGTVQNVVSGVLTLKPSNGDDTFTATVSGSSLTALSGTIKWTDNTTAIAPGSFTGTGNSGGNSGWIAVADSKFDNASIKGIVYGNGKFVAVGYYGKMAYSSDGVTWTAIPAGTGPGTSTFGNFGGGSSISNIYAIAYGNGKFVAVGDVGKTAYSTDGINWTGVNSGVFGYTKNGSDYTAPISSIAYGNGKFVAGGYYGIMATSTDGTSWTAVANSTFGNSTSINNEVVSIAYGNGKFVAVGYNGKIATSTDGTNWTAVVDTKFREDRKIYRVVYGNGTFVAVGESNQWAYSSDGVTWTARTWDVSVGAITFGNNKFISDKWGTSSDGVTWTPVAYSDNYFSAIAYGNGKFVGVCSDGKMAYLIDGDGGDNGGSDTLSGTWKAGDQTVTLNNGSFQVTENNKQTFKGTYTTSGSNITMVVTDIHGDALNELEDGPTFESKWYNKNQLIDVFKNWMKTLGKTDAEITTLISDNSANFDAMFPTATGTINGNTMILDDETYTKDTASSGGGATPTITTASLPNGTVGTAYSQRLTATGDTPITWSIASGTLPAGLSIAGTTGVISGTPTTASSSTFTVKATNAKGNDTKALTITIATGGSGSSTMKWTNVTTTIFDCIDGDGDAIRANLWAIAYGNDKFVAGGDYGKIATSTDGVTWTAVPGSPFGTASYNTTKAIAYGNGKFVAGGQTSLAYSSDGVTWTLVNNVFEYNQYNIYSIAYGNGMFIVGSLVGKMAYSTDDGKTWTTVTDSKLNEPINSIAYGNGKFVACGNDGGMAYSTDGITWIAIDSRNIIFDGLDKRYTQINNITYGNNKFVLGGNQSKMAYSMDGTNWTVVEPSNSAGNVVTTALAFGNGKFIVGSYSSMAYSTDGVKWTAEKDFSFSSDKITSIAYGNGKFVAVGYYGSVAYSTGN